MRTRATTSTSMRTIRQCGKHRLRGRRVPGFWHERQRLRDGSCTTTSDRRASGAPGPGRKSTTDGRLRAPVLFRAASTPRSASPNLGSDRAPPLRYHARAENILEIEACRRRHRRPACNAPIARAQDASVTLYGRLNVSHGDGQRQAIGCGVSRPVPQSERLPRDLQLVGIRNTRGRTSRERHLGDFPDREQRDR